MAGTAAILTTGVLDNTDGTVLSGGTLNATTSGALINLRGRMQAVGNASIDTLGQKLDNTAGRVASQATLTLTTGELANGAISSQAGMIGSNGNLTIEAGATTNSATGSAKSNIWSAQTASVTATSFTNAGVLSGGNVTLNTTTDVANVAGASIEANGDLSITTNAEPSLSVSLMLVLITFTLAALSLAFVERPVRVGRLLPGNRIFLFWGIGSGVLLVLGAIGMEKEGWSSRFKLPAQVQTSLTDHSPRGVCEPYKDSNGINASFCWLGADTLSSRAKVAVFGDSHAFPITAAFDEPAKAMQIAVVQSGIGGCLPFISANVIDGPNPFSSCSALAERQVRLVKEKGIAQVFLIARWSLYTGLGYDERKMYHVGETSRAPRSLSHSLSSFESALKKTVQAYAEVGAQVVLVSQVPQQVTHPLSVYYKVFSDGFRGNAQEAIDYASIDFARHVSIQRSSRQLFNAVLLDHDNVKHLVLDDLYCPASKCSMGTPTSAYYSDKNHISTDGALLARARFRAMLQSAFTPRLTKPAPASPK